MRIAFAFTGAGHLLRESVQVALKLAKEHEVTVFLSGAAEEVLKMYGLYESIVGITGGKYHELATDSNQKFSYPLRKIRPINSFTGYSKYGFKDSLWNSRYPCYKCGRTGRKRCRTSLYGAC